MRLGDDDLRRHAEGLALDMNRFVGCLEDKRASQQVDADLALARSIGFVATPSFLIGTTDPAGQVVVTQALVGARPLEEFASSIERLLTNTLRPVTQNQGK
jgi:predicted DsbA family dithiol-disulfide isomerase